MSLKLAVAALLLAASPALASDGVIEINQARALAGGVTPADTPGFPVTLSLSGSYRLSGNLALFASGNAIDIATSQVTLDLNGFTMSCAAGGGTSCPGGFGVFASSGQGVTVRDGFVRGFGVAGIRAVNRVRIFGVDTSNNPGNGMLLMGPDCVVTDSIADDNGQSGIAVVGNCTLERNVALRNGGNGIGTNGGVVHGCVTGRNVQTGITLGRGTVRNSMSYENGADGIAYTGSGGTVVGNTSRGNTGVGLRAPAPDLAGLCNDAVGYAHNVFEENNGGGSAPQVSGCAFQTDPNLCHASSTCP